MKKSVQELRDSIGQWDVTTEFLANDGTIASSHTGTYEFSWLIEDRVITGKSSIPDLELTSAILFYVNEKESKIEMVSVGKDGKLWVMTGELGGNVRTTPDFDTEDGGKSRLRFTRYNVSAESFESKMEYSSDSGKTWLQGNHQRFQRVRAM